MKSLSKISFILMLIAMLFTSCEKENIDEITYEVPDYEVETVNYNPLLQQLVFTSTDSILISCVAIPYPVDFLQSSGNTITVNSNEELDEALMQPDSLIDFVYPFDAVYNGNVVLIDDIPDLAVAITECSTTSVTCADLQPHVLLFFNGLNIFTINKYEYTINYPVSLIVEGNQVVLNNDDDYLPAVGGSPSNLLPTELVYPITITQFGQDIILNSDDDVCDFYDTLDEPCENKPEHIQFFFNEGPGSPINCTYFINYPLDITLDGITVNIQSRQDYVNELNSSSTAYDDIELVYPVTAIKYQGNEQLTFETDADICEFLNNCQ